jgi:hypothetical protein
VAGGKAGWQAEACGREPVGHIRNLDLDPESYVEYTSGSRKTEFKRKIKIVTMSFCSLSISCW